MPLNKALSGSLNIFAERLTMQSISLGIGSRLKHPDFGEGVVVQVRPDTYSITFMQHGMREISRQYEHFEIIDANDADNDLVSLFDIQESLVNIIRKFSDIQEHVDLAGKWAGGTRPYGYLVDKDTQSPVSFGHDFRRISDRRNLQGIDPDAIDLTFADVENERDPAEVVRGAEVERDTARAHQLA